MFDYTVCEFTREIVDVEFDRVRVKEVRGSGGDGSGRAEDGVDGGCEEEKGDDESGFEKRFA